MRRSDRVATAHGEVALVALADPDDDARLHADERAHATTLSAHRRREWIAGRTALRLLLGDVPPILADDRGAPRIPAGRVASVSHKDGHAAALVAADTGARIGVDLERAAPSRLDIAPRILTARELATLPDHQAPRAGAGHRGRAVTLRFAIKEAIYKAVDPFVRRYVGFTEVELDVRDDGSVGVTSALPLVIEATWREVEGFWLATARATGSDPTFTTIVA